MSNDEMATCIGKAVFPSKAAALASLRHGRRKRGRVPYQCPFCKKFHVGGGTARK